MKNLVLNFQILDIKKFLKMFNYKIVYNFWNFDKVLWNVNLNKKYFAYVFLIFVYRYKKHICEIFCFVFKNVDPVSNFSSTVVE